MIEILIVIQELIKDSQRKLNQSVDSTRLKPNLNFFQRTVSSLVSTNTRIDKKLDTVKAKGYNQNRKKSKSLVISNTRPFSDFTSKKPIHFVSAAIDNDTREIATRYKEVFKSKNGNKLKNNAKLKKLEKYIDQLSTDSEDDSDECLYDVKRNQHLNSYRKNHSSFNERNQVIIISSSDDDCSKTSGGRTTVTKTKSKHKKKTKKK